MFRNAAPLLAALLVCTRMDAAAACFDLGSACQDLEIFTGAFALHTEHIPIDGVLLIQVTGPDWMAVTPDQVDLQITLDGMPVAGALEDIGVAGVLAWRPAAPLVPLATYVVTGTVNNESIPPGPGSDVPFPSASGRGGDARALRAGIFAGAPGAATTRVEVNALIEHLGVRTFNAGGERPA